MSNQRRLLYSHPRYLYISPLLLFPPAVFIFIGLCCRPEMNLLNNSYNSLNTLLIILFPPPPPPPFSQACALALGAVVDTVVPRSSPPAKGSDSNEEVQIVLSCPYTPSLQTLTHTISHTLSPAKGSDSNEEVRTVLSYRAI